MPGDHSWHHLDSSCSCSKLPAGRVFPSPWLWSEKATSCIALVYTKQLKGVHSMESFFCHCIKDMTVSSNSFWPSSRCFMFGSWLCHLLPVWSWARHLLFPSLCFLNRPNEGEEVGRAGTSSGMINTRTSWWSRSLRARMRTHCVMIHRPSRTHAHTRTHLSRCKSITEPFPTEPKRSLRILGSALRSRLLPSLTCQLRRNPSFLQLQRCKCCCNFAKYRFPQHCKKASMSE